MSPRPPLTEQLLDYLEGRLDTDSALAVERLLGANEMARQRLEWLTEFREQAARTTVGPVPEGLRESLVDTFVRMRDIHRAELLHDSREVVAGVRSVGVAERWALIHTSDVCDVAIDLARAGDVVEVSGQVLPIGDRDVRGVELLTATATLASCPVDSHGQYACGDVPPGTYRLLVHLDQATVAVDLEIDAA